VPDESPAPVRPTAIEAQQLGFTPRGPVPWLGPGLLAGTAVRVGLAGLFGAYLDKRELQGAMPATVHDETVHDGQAPGADGEFWFDYTADLGDGFDSTYSIAYLLAQRQLTMAVDGREQALPAGSVLVLGGDQVYPTPSGRQYEDRFKGPYRAALPEPSPDDGPRGLYALPGNHDWYDGLTAFLRLFARADHGTIGGWCTRQSRSYFAIRLPNRWWLYALDGQTGSYLDDPQLRYFRQAAGQLGPDDRVILCAPTPAWVYTGRNPDEYNVIDYFVRTVIDPTGAAVRLMLSGDLHHYARYQETTPPSEPAGAQPEPAGAQPEPAGARAAGRQLITCGGGGAYLYPTHRLPPTLRVPSPASLVRAPSRTREYRLAGRFPSAARSSRYAAGVFGRLPRANPGFVCLLGVVHLLFMFAITNAADRVSSSVVQRLVTIPVGIMVVVMVGSAVLFAMPPDRRRRKPGHWFLGFTHGLAQLGVGVAAAAAWSALPAHRLPWPLPELVAATGYLPVVGLLAAEVVAGYLLVASAFDVNLNELFAAQAITDAKGFLRLRIGSDGALTIYPIGVDRVCHRWVANPDAAADRPWIEPTTPLRPHLIEPPIRLE
jgi:hypothetical protein